MQWCQREGEEQEKSKLSIGSLLSIKIIVTDYIIYFVIIFIYYLFCNHEMVINLTSLTELMCQTVS